MIKTKMLINYIRKYINVLLANNEKRFCLSFYFVFFFLFFNAIGNRIV